MMLALAEVLRDFRGPDMSLRSQPADSAAPAMAAPAPIGRGEKKAARLAEAFAKGEAAGRELAALDHERELTEYRAEANAQLVLARQQWVDEEGARLAARMTAVQTEVEARIATQVAVVLRPFIRENVREKMLRDLSAVISDMLAGGNYLRFRISGPEDLLARLREMVGADHPAFEWEAGEMPDVSVHVDDTLIETEIGRWIERCRGAE